MVSGRMRGTSPERTSRCLGSGAPLRAEVGLEHLHGVAGAALLGLEDEVDAGVFDGGFRTRSASWPMMQ